MFMEISTVSGHVLFIILHICVLIYLHIVLNVYIEDYWMSRLFPSVKHS